MTPASIAAMPAPAMAPISAYVMPRADEIALTRSAAPPSVSSQAEVMMFINRDGSTERRTPRKHR